MIQVKLTYQKCNEIITIDIYNNINNNNIYDNDNIITEVYIYI
jgi:hypothetical protein